ncbi:hypothetical protein A8L34_25375 [Bacillus sp. FJAT-27264]|uniref:TetR/AcrR family transcriptional regulator n=1 Tax=Paenibacillus sp. (strain DSM 101736 / FJAT-27264) TaxID=1850362 RepID=UPI000807B265|nr:TetR/AcrR family transcriptional regulator [Bacillus sp. FJAT-27264]OBZ07959.1 hypothetical protein A8L34_25375 [Bacillus sp. FJAT-27264]
MADRTQDKKEQIIKTAMQLFAVKGSSSTSMQEIAELSSMSKGSLYLLFKSKEELERSIYIYCFKMIRDPLVHAEQETGKTPREKLRNQVEILLNHVYELREFLQRQIQDFAGKGYSDIPEWLQKSNVMVMGWFQSKMESLYGKDILPYTGDLSMIAHGMIGSYVRVLFHPESFVPTARMADHLINMMDIIAASLLADKPAPLISHAMVVGMLAGQEGNVRKNPLQLIKEMKDLLGAFPLKTRQQKDAADSLAILEGEMLVSHPRRAIIQGMLFNLQPCPELAEPLKELRKLLSPYMHNQEELNCTP